MGTGTGEEIVSDSVKLAGAAEKETTADAAAMDEYEFSVQLKDDDNSSDDGYVPLDNFYTIIEGRSLSSSRVAYFDEDSDRMRMAYGLTRYMVELLAVRPRFRFLGTLVAFTSYSIYYCSSQRGQICRTVDSQGNLILHNQGRAIMKDFSIKINIPEDDNMIEDDVGGFSYTVDPHKCNIAETRTITTARNRRIDVTFLPMHTAIEANVYVTLGRLISCGNIVYYVYGEITACHQLYADKSVMLFSRGKEDKVQVINGKLPLSRKCAAVPIYLEPLLKLKLNLCVLTNQDDGRICFQDDITFYRDEYEKMIFAEDHDYLKVMISYD